MKKIREKVKRRESIAASKDVPARRPRLWVRRISRVVSLLAVGLIVAHWFWGRSNHRALEEQIRAYAAAGEAIYPADLNDPAVADSENAVVDLREAGRRLRSSDAAWLTLAQRDLKPPFSSREMEDIYEVMRANRGALEALEAAASKKGIDWQIKFASPMLDVRYEEMPNVLALASLLRMGALYAHQDGAEGEALRRIGEMLALARITDRQRKISAHVTAASIAALAAETAAQIGPDLKVRSPSVGKLSGLIGEFLDDGWMRDGQTRTLLLTRVMFWDTCEAVAGGRTDLLAGGGSGIVGGRVGCYALRPLIMSDGVWLVQYMSKIVNAAKFSADWPEFCQNAPALPMEMVENRRGHLVARLLMPDLPRLVRGHYRALAECRLGAVALAAGWYRGEHSGAQPAALGDLQAGYLPYVPFDPMAGGGKPLRMNAEKRVIYSVGDDGADDGGSEAGTGGAGPWDRRDFVVELERRAAGTKPASTAR
jgi:hypothetical protein